MEFYIDQPVNAKYGTRKEELCKGIISTLSHTNELPYASSRIKRLAIEISGIAHRVLNAPKSNTRRLVQKFTLYQNEVRLIKLLADLSLIGNNMVLGDTRKISLRDGNDTFIELTRFNNNVMIGLCIGGHKTHDDDTPDIDNNMSRTIVGNILLNRKDLPFNIPLRSVLRGILAHGSIDIGYIKGYGDYLRDCMSEINI